MKMENNWRYKSLQNLEKDAWNEPVYPTHLVTRCHALRRIPLNQFTVEDLRIMICQQIGLTYLIPLAFEKLKNDILAEGDCYPGDLLIAVTKVSPEYWKVNSALHITLKELIATNHGTISKEGLIINNH
jgi:hypothetical protein